MPSLQDEINGYIAKGYVLPTNQYIQINNGTITFYDQAVAIATTLQSLNNNVTGLARKAGNTTGVKVPV